MSSFIARAGVSVGLAFVALVAPASARADELTGPPIDRAAVLREAVRQHPAIAAATARAQSAALSAAAAGKLPPPEAMVQIWQIPIARPYAIGDAGMAMIGVSQAFPAPGTRDARESAGRALAGIERAMIEERARLLRRDADHAFAEYVEATDRHRVHVEHHAVAVRAVELARARLAAGAALTDVAQAETELARDDADVVGDRSRMLGARARLAAVLLRDPGAPLGPPALAEPVTTAWDLGRSRAEALSSRPEILASKAEMAGRAEEARAARHEATRPSFSVAALYFAPVGSMPAHGYGANAAMSLPWVWGEAGARRDAADAQAVAARRSAEAAPIAVAAEVAQADAMVRAAAERLLALRDRALPAGKRAFEIAWTGYESGRTDLATLLATRRAVVDVESELVAARAGLAHALVELDAAVGQEVPRAPIGGAVPKGADDGH